MKNVITNVKRGLINWFKSGNLIVFAGISFILGSVALGEGILTYIYTISTSEGVQDDLLKYIDYCNILEKIIPNDLVRKGLFFIIVILWFCILYFRVIHTEVSKGDIKTIHVLGHSTLGKSQFKLDEEASKHTQIEVQELNLIEEVSNAKTDFKKLNYVVNTQDNFIEKFKRTLNNTDSYGYMGISHTPFILRAGFKIGDETKFRLFHYYRNPAFYKELDDNTSYPPLRIEKKDMKVNCRELIVTIATTFDVKDNELSILRPGDKSILKFKLDTLGFDVIKSKRQVDDYVGLIMNEIRTEVKESGILKIHMCIASSIEFTFALGQAISINHDKEITIYSYVANDPKLYPWGINLFKDSSDCIVVN